MSARTTRNIAAAGLSSQGKSASARSLPEVHGSIAVPHGADFWRKMLAFAGPGYLVAVGYTLLSVIMISNLIAILL